MTKITDFSSLTTSADGDLVPIVDVSDTTQSTDGTTKKITRGDLLERVVVYKTADETVNNSTTLQNDDALTFAVAANEVWAFKLVLVYNSGTTPDIKYGFSVPASATIDGYALSTGSVSESSTLSVSGHSSLDRVEVLHANIINSSTAGSMTIQWAQNTQDASDTTVKQGSHIIAHKLA